MRESRDPNARSLDMVGTTLITAALFLIIWALIKTTAHAWLSAYTLGFLAAGIVLMAIFLWWESHHSEPMIPLEFFKRRAFSASAAVVALVGVGLFGIIYYLTLYFQNVRGYDPQQAGLRSLPMTMMILIVAPIGGRLNGKVSPRALMTTGMLMASVGLFFLSRIGVDTSYNYIWPCQILMGAGMALTMPAVSATGMAAVEPTRAGIASGVINASRQVGGAFGIAILGSVGATLAANSWNDKLAHLPPAVQARGQQLTELVQGGQGRLITEKTHLPAVGNAALESFQHGVQGALLVAAFLLLGAAFVAFFGLRNMVTAQAPPQEAEQAAQVPIEV